MSYTVLARRYRSQTFDQVIGQAHIAQTLKKAISAGRVAHAYLFVGTRGTGKTSTARILAKALNCLSADAPTPTPCGTCSACVGIARGDDLDCLEIDAASNTGVDDVRQIIENAAYRPTRCRFKIYIIDEVHMLSKNAFNALLKTLEEPPAHVKFILATTEAEKVLPTILSRVQRYDFRNIPTREIAAHLRTIVDTEKLPADDDALLMVAKAGAGSMRDSLSLLDRLLGAGEPITPALIEQTLGLPRAAQLADLTASIAAGDVPAVLTKAAALVDTGLAPDSLIGGLVDHLRDLMILRATGAAGQSLVDAPAAAMPALLEQAAHFDPAALAQDIVILEELRRQLRMSQAGRALLDATLVRLTLADQFASIADLLSGVAPSPAPEKKKPLTAPSPAGATRADTTLAPPVSVSVVPVDAGASSPADDDDDLPRPGKVWSAGDGPSLKDLLKADAAARPPAPPPAPKATPPLRADNFDPVAPDHYPQVWRAVLDRFKESAASLHAVLTQGRFAGISDDGLAVVRFNPNVELLVRSLDKNGRRDAIRDAFSDALRQPVGLRFELDAPLDAPPEPAVATPTPAPRAAAPTTPPAAAPPPAPTVLKLTDDVIAQLHADPLVRAVLDELGGQLTRLTED